MYSIHIVCLYVFLEDGPFYCCVMVLSLALKPALYEMHIATLLPGVGVVYHPLISNLYVYL